MPTKDETADRLFSTDHLLRDLQGRSVRGGAITVAAQATKFVVQMASTFVLARLLTPQDFGLMAMVAVFTGFVALFKDLGLSAATVQRDRITHQQVSTLFWINLAIGAALMLVAFAVAPVVAWFYGEPRLGSITMAIGATFIFGGLIPQHTALLRRQMRFGTIAAIEITAMIGGIGVAIIMARLGTAYWALVAMMGTTAVLTFVLTWLCAGWRPGLPRRGTDVRTMLAFGGNLSAVNALNYIGAHIDDALIGRYWGAGALGQYSRAYSLLTLPLSQLMFPLGSVAVPALSRAVAQPGYYRRAYLSTVQLLMVVVVPPVAVMITCSDWLVTLVLGSQWLETARLFSILGFGAFLLPIWNSSGWLFVSQGRTREHLRFHMIDSAVKILFVLAGLRWGAPGVAVAVGVRYYVMLPLLLWIVGRRGPVSTRDVFRLLTLPATVWVACLASTIGVRASIGPVSPILGLSVAMAAAGLAAIAFAATPPGRRVAKDALLVAKLLAGRSQPEHAL
jgi:O-antigen/teichoic acid export membrane protein